MTTWRSIEKDPPRIGQRVWLSSHEQRYDWSIEWSPSWMKANWTHWSHCEPPADLPPAPKTPFEEWVDGFRKLDFGCVWITDNKGTGGRVAACMAKIIFEAGYEAGKASHV